MVVEVEKTAAVESIRPASDEVAPSWSDPREDWADDEEGGGGGAREQGHSRICGYGRIDLAGTSKATESIVHLRPCQHFTSHGISGMAAGKGRAYAREAEADETDQQDLSPWVRVKPDELGLVW